MVRLVERSSRWSGQQSDHSTSTLCELYPILDAVGFICQRGVNGAIICDSRSAQQSFFAVQLTQLRIVRQILSFLTFISACGLCVKYIWIYFHVDLRHNATPERLAKETRRLPYRGDGHPLSLPCYFCRVGSDVLLSLQRRRYVKKLSSVTNNHYKSVCCHRFTYRRRDLMVPRQNLVSASLRLRCRPAWQVAGVEREPSFTECHLCGAPLTITIEQYCLQCPIVGHIPKGLPLDVVCLHILTPDVLDEILVNNPRFGEFSRYLVPCVAILCYLVAV